MLLPVIANNWNSEVNLVYIIHRNVTKEAEGATIIYVVIMYISRPKLSLNIYPVEFFLSNSFLMLYHAKHFYM